MQLLSTWPVYLKEIFKFREDRIGSLLAINTILIVFFEMPLVHWLEKYRKIRIIALGALLLCPGFGLLPIGGGYILLLLW